MYAPAVALSGIFVPSPWLPTPLGALATLKAKGFKRVQLPFWLGNSTAALQNIVSVAYGFGLDVDLVPHVDGPSSAAWQYVAFDDPAAYASEVQSRVSGLRLKPTSSLQWWNELSPRDIGDWGPLTALYTGLGNDMHRMVRALGCQSVAPFPMSQTPQDVRDELMGMFSPQNALAPDRWAAHLYEDDLATSDVGLQTLAGQMAVLDAAQTILERPVDLSEYGGSAAFYVSVAAACRASGRRACAWQWVGPGTGLEVWSQASVIAGIVGAATSP